MGILAINRVFPTDIKHTHTHTRTHARKHIEMKIWEWELTEFAQPTTARNYMHTFVVPMLRHFFLICFRLCYAFFYQFAMPFNSQALLANHSSGIMCAFNFEATWDSWNAPDNEPYANHDAFSLKQEKKQCPRYFCVANRPFDVDI